MTGSAGQRRVPEHFLASLQIPLPPLPEQRRIAAILDKAEALRAKRRAAIQKLDELTQSIFLDMFGDPATNPKSWPNQSLDELFDIARGGSPRPIDAFITEADDGVNWIMIGDTTEGGKYITRTRKRIKPEGVSRSRMVKPGDFLLTNSMSFGRPYILQTSGCIHDGWLVLSPRSSGFESDYFYTLLGSRAVYAEFQRRASGATVKNLNIELVHGVRVPVAPASEQKRFAASVACIEDARRQLVSASSRLDDLFASLQQRAFRGEL
jgi:restriction endonuclease S subunit